MPSRTALLRLYYFVFFSSIGAYIPYFPAWLRARGIEGFSMSAITALWPLLGIVSPIVFGIAADSLGLRGSLLRVAAVGTLVPFAAMSVCALVLPEVPYGVLFGLVLVLSFFRPALVSLADVVALESPGSYGKTRLFGSAGFLAMAVAAGALLDPAGAAEIPLAITAALLATTVVTFALPARGPAPPAPVLTDAARLVRSPDYLLFLLGCFLWYAAHVSYDLCFSLHLADLGARPGLVGAAWAIGVVAEIALMHSGHRLLERFSPLHLLLVSFCGSVARFALIGAVRSLDVLLLLQPLHAVTFGLFWVTALDVVRRRAPPGLLATAQSLFSTSTSLGSAVGMLAWGPLFAAGGGQLVFTAAAAVAGLGGATSLLRGVVEKRAGAVTAPPTA